MFMSLFLFILLILLLIGVVAYAVGQKTKAENALKLLADLEGKTLQMEKEKEHYLKESIRLQASLEGVQNQLNSEKKGHEEQKKMLTEQLSLLGSELIAKGTKTLKEESGINLNEVLKPFKEKLETFEKQVRESQVESLTKFSNMEGIIKLLSTQHEQMNTTAQGLVSALRGENKVQGDWGEMALERILESSGLVKGQEYSTQSSYKDENNRHLRPDVIIHLPDDKQLIIDSKVSLKAFDNYINEEDPILRTQALKEHINSLKTHIKLLGDKKYTDIPGINTLEFVLLFIPLESSFALAVREEPGLYELAMDKKIVLVTPSTLLATLKTIDSIWKHERQNKNAIEIAQQAGLMYDKLVNFVGDLEKVGAKQRDALSAQEEAMKKLVSGKGNLVGRAEKLRKLGIKTNKKIENKHLEDEELDELE